MATKLQQSAQWFYDRMVADKRDNGDTFYKFRDELPEGEVERCRAMAMYAHESANMLPDDWRYEFIREALSALADAEDADEIDLEADVYTSELTRWLGSRADRMAYCDEAIRDGYCSAEADTFTRLQCGQAKEKAEVLSAVRNFLETEIENDGDDASDDADKE